VGDVGGVGCVRARCIRLRAYPSLPCRKRVRRGTHMHVDLHAVRDSTSGQAQALVLALAGACIGRRGQVRVGWAEAA
jgi:hypothetical protein